MSFKLPPLTQSTGSENTRAVSHRSQVPDQKEHVGPITRSMTRAMNHTREQRASERWYPSLRNRAVDQREVQSSESAGCTEDIQEQILSPRLERLLRNEGANDQDIQGLRERVATDEFITALLELGVEKESRRILQSIDRDLRAQFQRDIESRISDLGALLRVIPQENEPELEEAPLGMDGVVFLSSNIRNQIRSAYFPEGISQFDEQLSSWLLQSGIPEDYLEQLRDLEDQTLIHEIINFAIEWDLFELLQALPPSAANEIREQVVEFRQQKENALRVLQSVR